jgi:hypothetical protein
MNIGGIATVVFATLMLVFGIQQTVLLWTGSDRFKYRESKPPNVPFPASLWSHYVRTFPVIVFGGGVSIAMGSLIAAVANGIGTIVFALMTVVSMFVLAPMIFLFNQPKALVPPSLRDEAGWLTARRST